MGVATNWAELIADVGLVLLRNGAETYRTSETMEYTRRSLGTKKLDIFMIPSTVMVSLTVPSGDSATVIRKVTDRTLNLDRVSRINELSRSVAVGNCTYEYAKKQVTRICRERTGFSTKASIAFSGLVGIGFAVMQNGNWAECIVAFFPLLWFA